jgi:hypothetical protein
MPYFAATGSIAAGASAYPLANWQYRQPNFPAVLEMMVNGSATGLTHSLTTGSESIVPPDTAVSGGGTAGTMPSRLATEPIVDGILPGEEIVHLIKNPTAGAITYNVVYVITPKVA